MFTTCQLVPYLDLPLCLTVTNPTHSNMVVTLLPYCQVGDDSISDKNTPPLCGKLILQSESFDIPGETQNASFDKAYMNAELGWL